jgi:hypothetical protein
MISLSLSLSLSPVLSSFTLKMFHCNGCDNVARYECSGCGHVYYCGETCSRRDAAHGLHYCKHVTIDRFVPEDGRTEYEDKKFQLRSQTTLFHSRVDPSVALTSSGSDVFSKFFGLTLSHPCTVLLQHLFVDPEQPTGHPIIFEYETQVPLKLRSYGFNKYDELYLPTLSTATFAQDLKVTRAYNLNRVLIMRSSILAFMHGHDGGKERTSISGRWVESPPIPGIALDLVALSRPHFDADYLHMRQFWQKALEKKMSWDAVTLQAILCGSDLSGPPILQRHAFYVYDTSKRFTFKTPIVYRDADPSQPRADMRYVVAVVVVYTGTKDYDKTGGFTLTRERLKYAPILHQGEILGCVVEKGYEDRVLPVIDAALARLPWEKGLPVRVEWPPASQANFPLLQSAFAAKAISLLH